MTVPRVAAEPFVAWCQRRLRAISNHGAIGILPTNPTERQDTIRPGTHTVLAHRLGIEPRTLWRYLHRLDGSDQPTATISRYAVEDMLTRAGEDFYALYPEYEHERDVELEPDGWCPHCQELTTPVEGKCLWCEGRLMRLVHRDRRPARSMVKAITRPGSR